MSLFKMSLLGRGGGGKRRQGQCHFLRCFYFLIASLTILIAWTVGPYLGYFRPLKITICAGFIYISSHCQYTYLGSKIATTSKPRNTSIIVPATRILAPLWEIFLGALYYFFGVLNLANAPEKVRVLQEKNRVFHKNNQVHHKNNRVLQEKHRVLQKINMECSRKKIKCT